MRWKYSQSLRNAGPSSFRTLILQSLALAAITELALAQEPSVPQTISSEKQPGGAARAELTQETALIAGKGENHASGTARLQTARRLSVRLRREDIQALLELVSGERPPDIELPLWRALVNDVEDRLLLQERPVTDLEMHFVRALENRKDPVLRDYAAQKLGTLLTLPCPDSVRITIVAALDKAARREGQDLQGTALLAWRRAFQSPSQFSPELKAAVAACLASPGTTTPARLTALQLAADASLSAAAPAARSLLNDAASSVAAKRSALSALGKIGSFKEDAALLTSLSANQFLGEMAAAAMERLSSQQE